MRQMIKNTLGFAGLFILLITLTGCPGSPMARQWEAERKQKETYENAPQYLVPYFRASGKVGHHMNAGSYASCSGNWGGYATHESGSLPPGISFEGGAFVGTPRSPGQWEVWVHFADLRCTSGAGNKRDYPDRSVRATINIEGDAPRRLR